MGKFDPFPDARPSTEIPATHGLSRGTTGVAAILASENANIGGVLVMSTNGYLVQTVPLSNLIACWSSDTSAEKFHRSIVDEVPAYDSTYRP
jgi:hypothetical protein